MCVCVCVCLRACVRAWVGAWVGGCVIHASESLVPRMAYARFHSAPLCSYTSMHQKDTNGTRTPEEKASFGRALQNMTIFYAHKLTTVYMMTRHPYEHGYPTGYDAEHPGCSQHVKLYAERGWTSFERANAELIKPADHGNAWPQVIDVGMPPTAFSRFVPSARWLCGLIEAPRWWLSRYSGSRIEPLYLSAKRNPGTEKATEEWLLRMLEGGPSCSQRVCHAIASFVNALLPGYYMLSHRVAPASPRAFYDGGRYSTEKGVSFTNGSDVTVVATLFEKTTKTIYSSVRTLDYAGMGWTDQDLDQLLDVLAYTDAEVPRGSLCARVQVLTPSHCHHTAVTVPPHRRHTAATLLPHCRHTAGTLPRVHPVLWGARARRSAGCAFTLDCCGVRLHTDVRSCTPSGAQLGEQSLHQAGRGPAGVLP